MRSAEEYIIGLLRCALHGQLPERKSENCSWEMLWYLACRNNIECTVSPAIQNYPYEMPEDLASQWKMAINRKLNRILQFDFERENILSNLDAAGVASLPLKGIIIAEYYPVPGMRWMCDNDILFGYVAQNDKGKWYVPGRDAAEQNAVKRKAAEKVYDVMIGLGYKGKIGKGHHDIYHKAPIFNFEMHQMLLAEGRHAADYYQNPWEKAIPEKEGQYRFAYKDEDVYIYHIAHAYKHFNLSGCGLRILVDEYVLLDAKRQMDWMYIKEELDRIQLSEFEERLKNVALHAFAVDGKMEQEDWQLVHQMLDSGTYGKMEYRVQKSLDEIAKEKGYNSWRTQLAYFGERIWLKETDVKAAYPFFYRHPALRIVLPLWRLINALLFRPKRVWSECKLVLHYRHKNNLTK